MSRQKNIRPQDIYNSSIINTSQSKILLGFFSGDGSTAADIRRHFSPRAGPDGLGPAETHSATRRVQPCHQENRQLRPAVERVQLYFNNAEEPRILWK